MCVLENAFRNLCLDSLPLCVYLVLYRGKVESVILNFLMCFLVSVVVMIEYVDHGGSSAHEVGVLSVDVGVLDLNEILYHLVGWH